MADAITRTLNLLHKKGFRKSVVRELILRTITLQHRPISAPEILDLLGKQGKSCNKTTIYRELEILKKSEYIKELFLRTDVALYELAGHRHHIMCVHCGDIQHIQVTEPESQKNKKQAERLGYTILDHSLEFFGLCQKCQ